MIGRWIFIRDGRLNRRTWAAIALATLAALLAMLPLRLVLGLAGNGRTLSAQAVEGVAWDGLVGEMQIGPLSMGLMEVDLMPLPLLVGQAKFAIERPDSMNRAPFRARVSSTLGTTGIENATGELALAGMFAPLPVRALTMQDFSASIADGQCVAASGTLGLAVPAMGAFMPAETVLAGEARCENGALVVPMTGPSGNERVDLSIKPDGSWRAVMSVAGLPPEMAEPLEGMGFVARPNGAGQTTMGLTASGTL
ncbi:type II secretion system protein N [Croceicoccus mobilis]|uniref:Type II secretion system protein N n=1 Tax=Croceicoccus mobilis TaxID=1703339 RepID=A0A916Z080_9SPHN|nr:type II secretion system protein N [Croceicoccus mobilis]GGD69254.1 hypothetical protein GCM10010990_18490 [Croceicoccus mobilis]